MHPSRQQFLFDTYPEFFQDKDSPMTETCMCWGIECGDGWFDLIRNLCSNLSSLLTMHDIELSRLKFTQIKEKYGNLRVYHQLDLHGIPLKGLAELIDYQIYKAECESGRTCEICGSKEEVSFTKGYIQALCMKCDKRRKKVA